MVRFAHEHAEIEGGNDALLAVAKLPFRAHKTPFDQLFADVEAIQHVECRWMKCRSSQIVGKIWTDFDDGNRNAGLR